MCILSVVYVFFMVPETKNRTLEELDALFGDKSDRASWEAGVLLIAQREVGLLRLANIDDSFGGGGSGEKDNRSVDSGSGKEKHPDTVSHREHA